MRSMTPVTPTMSIRPTREIEVIERQSALREVGDHDLGWVDPDVAGLVLAVHAGVAEDHLAGLVVTEVDPT